MESGEHSMWSGDSSETTSAEGGGLNWRTVTPTVNEDNGIESI